mgnify:CR=1 FL=1
MVDELSRGMQQRLCLARAMIHRPQLLVMDEPASGLDPGARRIFKEVLRSLCEEGYTVLISSHILSDLADMCSNIGVIHQGKMVLEGPIDEIMTSIDSSNPILIEVYQNLEIAVHLLNRHPLVSRIAIDKNMIPFFYRKQGRRGAASETTGGAKGAGNFFYEENIIIWNLYFSILQIRYREERQYEEESGSGK